jgi:hypothetical protein
MKIDISILKTTILILKYIYIRIWNLNMKIVISIV